MTDTKDDKMTFSFLEKPVRIADQVWSPEVKPFVSISCITFNHENYVRDAIEGFLMQETTFPVEILMHDDASTDGTASIIREYEARHPSIFKVIYQKENQYSKKVKIGFTYQYPRVKGKYYATCEGDDYWTDPLKLQKQVGFLETHPDFTLTCGGFIRKETSGQTQEVINNPKLFPKKWGAGFEFDLNDLHKAWLTKTLTALFRVDALNFGELAQYKYARDVHLFYHLIKAGKGFYFQEVMGVYNIHEGGVFSMIPKKTSVNKAYQLHKEMYFLHRDGYTQKLFFNMTLEKLKFDLRHGYPGNDFRSRFRLLRDSFRLMSRPSEGARLIKHCGFFVLTSIFSKPKPVD